MASTDWQIHFLKLFCLFICALSAIQIYLANNRDDAFWGIASAILCAGAFYGVQKRALVTWKLGFVWIVIGGCLFLVQALSDARLRNFDRRVAVPFLVIATISVSAYWSRWWYGKKDYFSRP